MERKREKEKGMLRQKLKMLLCLMLLCSLCGCGKAVEVSTVIITEEGSVSAVEDKVDMLNIADAVINLPIGVDKLPEGSELVYDYNTQSLGGGEIGTAKLTIGEESKNVVYAAKGEIVGILGYWDEADSTLIEEKEGTRQINKIPGTHKGIITYGDGSEWLMLTDVRVIRE